MNKKTDKRNALIDLELIAYAHAAKADTTGTELRALVEMVQWQIHAICNRCATQDYHLVVSGRDNFRKVLYPDYKAGRPEKPPLYVPLMKELKTLFPERWRMHDQLEADDLLGIMMTNGRVPGPICCSIDKDMLGVPGYHYNWNKDEWPGYVSQEQADHQWLKQLLMGDSTDNIQGMKGIGEKKAEKLIEDNEYSSSSIPQVAKFIYEKEKVSLDDYYKCLYLVSIWRNPMPEELLDNELIEQIVKTIPSL